MNQDPTRGAGVVFILMVGIFALAMVLDSCERQRSAPSTQPSTTMATPELSNSGVPQDVLAILTGYFSDAQGRLAEIVRHPYGRTDAAKEFRQARAATQGTQIDQILTRLRGQTADWIGNDDTFRQAVQDGRERADRQAVEAGVRDEAATAGSFHLIDARTAAVFAQDAARDLNKATGLMGDRSKGLLRATAQNDLSERDINKLLAGGAIEGKPLQTIHRLRDAFNAVVKNGAIEINGRDYDVAKYAEMVVRTKTREAVEVSRHQRLQGLGIDLVAVIGRLSNNFCSAFLGQVFSIGGSSPKYPSLGSLPGGGPPFHPNCSKSTRPFIAELANDQQLEDAETVPDAKKLIGQTTTEAQRTYKDLQLRQQLDNRYRDTAETLYGAADPGQLRRQRAEARAKELEAATAAQTGRKVIPVTAKVPTPPSPRKTDVVTVRPAQSRPASTKTIVAVNRTPPSSPQKTNVVTVLAKRPAPAGEMIPAPPTTALAKSTIRVTATPTDRESADKVMWKNVLVSLQERLKQAQAELARFEVRTAARKVEVGQDIVRELTPERDRMESEIDSLKSQLAAELTLKTPRPEMVKYLKEMITRKKAMLKKYDALILKARRQ